MATPAEKLAESLTALKALQDDGVVAIKSDSLTRTHRERLLSNNFIEEVYKGWYIAIQPDAAKGDTTSWYSNYWQFCAQHLEERFSQQWCLSPEASLLLHAGNTAVPKQLIVRSPQANNSTTPLPHGTSLFLLKADIPAKEERIVEGGLQMYSAAAALIRCSPTTFVQNAIDVRTILASVGDASELLTILLDGGHSVIGGRIAGAFRNIGRDTLADTIVATMQSAGYAIRETDPFESMLPFQMSGRARSPYEARIRLMWQQMREKVLQHFPTAPGLPENSQAYLEGLQSVYVMDAYHSLSIEKYRVTPELIERVRTGSWDAKSHDTDRQQRDAMAARGYWDAFQAVTASIERILNGDNPGTTVAEAHSAWYQALFGPSVRAGILKVSDLAGYRNHQVYIGRSMHTPLNKDAVRDAMPVLFELLQNEPEASVRAVLGHFVFVFIHPYMDGNGRMGRFLMNAMLASGGYPWTIIPVEQREDYMQALEAASVGGDIDPFAKFLGRLLSNGFTPLSQE